jgi:hypothetical protein
MLVAAFETTRAKRDGEHRDIALPLQLCVLAAAAATPSATWTSQHQQSSGNKQSFKSNHRSCVSRIVVVSFPHPVYGALNSVRKSATDSHITSTWHRRA